MRAAREAAKDRLHRIHHRLEIGHALRRALGQYIEDPLAENLLMGEFKSGDEIQVTRVEGQDHLTFKAVRSEDGGGGGGGDGGTPSSPTTPPLAGAQH